MQCRMRSDVVIIDTTRFAVIHAESREIPVSSPTVSPGHNTVSK